MAGLFAAMAVTGSYRYFMEKKSMMDGTRAQAEQSLKLMAELAVPFLIAYDYAGVYELAESFMRTPDAQEITISDKDGRQLIERKKPQMAKGTINPGPLDITSQNARLGVISLGMYPANLAERLRTLAASTLIEHLFIFLILSAILYFSVSRIVTSPAKALGERLKEVIDRRDFTWRVSGAYRGEIGSLAEGVNYLLEHLERTIIKMEAISARISELSPVIGGDSREIRKNSDAEAEAISSVSSSVAEMSASVEAIATSAESLSRSAESSSSSILEMNASSQEVARHTSDLASSVEDVTTSVAEMIASIREVAGHVSGLASSAEQASASAAQIEAAAREVEQAASEAAMLSQQVSSDAKDMGVRSIQETISAMDRIKDAVGRYSALVTRLGKRSEEIGKILAVIAEVAEQTNLLALNASILAAQAGEHGKGFAVVAEEIKALAERTAGSTQDIAKLIGSVQKEAKEAVAAMNEGMNAVENGVNRSKSAAAALDKILSSSDRSAETSVMIKKSMTEQSVGIRQVSQAFSNVKQMTAQIAAATEAESKGADMILHAAEEMREISRRVKTAMVEQTKGGSQIAAAAENVTRQAGQIASATREQRQGSRQILEAMSRVQDLPRQNITRMEGMSAALKSFTEQAELLKQEFSAIKVRKELRQVESEALKIGVIPLESPAEMHKRFTPLATYLSTELGRRTELLLSVDFEHTLKDLEEGATDVAFLTPTTYIEAARRFGAMLVVKALRKGKPFSHSVIAAAGGRGINGIEDIRGKKMAFGDRMSTSSYLMPRYMLLGAGIRMEDLGGHGFLGHHDDVARAVLSGEYDAGGLAESVAKKFADQGLNVVKVSEDVPEFNICASRKLRADAVAAVKKALIKLDANAPRHANVLTSIDREYTGFVEASDGDYDIIRRIIEKIG